MGAFLGRLSRRKQLSPEEMEKTDLARCLTTLDLTALGVGSTLGAGAYVIAGTVAKTSAGPAVILSFFVAAVASVLAGLCYAEFGARVPKAGSAYIYTYVSVGEFLAFVIGWNLILEYVIGAASVARTFSGYFDDLVGGGVIPFFNSTMPIHVNTLAPYFDPMALGITFLVTLILAVGVKESAMFTNIFTLLNLLVLTYIIVCGLFKDDPANWAIPKSKVPDASHCGSLSKEALIDDTDCCGRADGCGEGGFVPYGFAGIMRGAATCFFAFVGFDAIATTGEEVKNPQRAIPLAILASLLVVFLFYSGISVTLTMMAPYYRLANQAPFSAIFQHVGWTSSKYVIGIGAICALTTSLVGGMFPMPRVVLAMGRDGVIFRFFARVHPRLQTPVIATLFTGTLASFMAAIFDIEALVNMMSIGTLLAYTLVSACVMLLRFEHPRLPYTTRHPYYPLTKFESKETGPVNMGYGTLFPEKREEGPTPASFAVVRYLIGIFIVCVLVLCGLMTFFAADLSSGHFHYSQVFLGLAVILSVGSLFLVSRQPQSLEKLPFTVPFVPWFPGLSIFFNLYLMFNLDYLTWIRFAGWLTIGLLIYFSYGIWHSTEEIRAKNGSFPSINGEKRRSTQTSDLSE